MYLMLSEKNWYRKRAKALKYFDKLSGISL